MEEAVCHAHSDDTLSEKPRHKEGMVSLEVL
jgi:hypothetical protein